MTQRARRHDILYSRPRESRLGLNQYRMKSGRHRRRARCGQGWAHDGPPPRSSLPRGPEWTRSVRESCTVRCGSLLVLMWVSSSLATAQGHVIAMRHSNLVRPVGPRSVRGPVHSRSRLSARDSSFGERIQRLGRLGPIPTHMHHAPALTLELIRPRARWRKQPPQ